MALTYEQIQAAAKKKGISQENVDKFAKAKGVVNPMKPADTGSYPLKTDQSPMPKVPAGTPTTMPAS